MDRRSFLGAVTGAVAMTGLSSEAAARDGERQPNIVFIESDSMDGRVMGCMGHPAAHTPHLDALATRGVLFEQAYCNSPQCCPSRASMWSGRYVHRLEAWNNARGIAPVDRTFETALTDAGYRCAVTGKTDYLTGGHSLGARVWAWTRAANIALPQKKRPEAILREDVEEGVHQRDWSMVAECADWLSNQEPSDEQPFFLYVGIRAPHPPFVTSAHWLEQVAADRVTLPPQDSVEHPVMHYMRATKNCLYAFTPEEILAIRRTYYAMVCEVDAMVGKIVAALEEAGLTGSTCVIYTSDHGEMNMEHGQYLKNSMYESSAHVPLTVAGPGMRRGHVSSDPVSLVDVFPTLMDVAGAPCPGGLDGHSLMPALTGQPDPRPAWVLSEYHSNFQNTGSFMLREGPWKYIAYPGYAPQLFNIEEDPDEISDLAAVKQDVVREMDGKLRDIVDYETVDAEAKRDDRADFRAWRATLSDEEYSKTMAKLLPGWDEVAEQSIQRWLAEG